MKIFCLILVLSLTGCAAQKSVNDLIAAGNTNRFTAFTKGMNAATSPEARVAIAMAFAANMGTQPFFRERDGVDYLKAITPYANLFMPFLYGGGDDSEASFTAGRDIIYESSANKAWDLKDSSLSGTEYLLSNSRWESPDAVDSRYDYNETDL